MRKLSLPFVITFVLSLVSSGKQQGVDGQLGFFVRNAKRNKAFDKIEAVHRSSITRARLKINWQLFESLFYRVVKFAYEVFPHRKEYLWEGLNVIAIDGSKYRLPASKEIRTFFDPKSGFENKGRGHYPLCLVSTAYDVFRGIPIARKITSYNDANERQDAIGFVDKIPANSVVLLDRGYTGYELIRELSSREDIFFSIRCPVTSTFSVLREFMDGKKKDSLLEIGPTNRFLTKYGIKKFREAPKIKLRAIKWKAPDGTMSLLVTNLTNRKKYTKAKVIGLYFKRWAVETHFRDEKVSFNVEQFHSKSVNGVKQELFAINIAFVIARTLAALSGPPKKGKKTISEPQTKHAIVTLSSEMSLLCSTNHTKAIILFGELISEIQRVRYHRRIIPKPSPPRVSKAPVNKWREDRKKKMRA